LGKLSGYRNLFAFAPDGTIPACVLDVPGSLDVSAVPIFNGLYTLLTEFYFCNGGKIGMDSALEKSDSDFIVKSGHKVWFDLRENVVWKIGKPHLHDNILNGE
jgi:hypothetical protein